MNLMRCNRRHFYDGDKFKSCPHCTPDEADEYKTIPINSDENDMNDDTVQLEKRETFKLKDAVDESRKSVVFFNDDDDDDDDIGLTVHQFEGENGIEPCVGWLVGINGKSFGESFPLKSGKNFIGRSDEMDVCLRQDNKVSRKEHAILIFDPKSRMFIAIPGNSKELYYLNDELVLNSKQMKKNDILLIGDTKLMLIPCCDEQFSWEDMMNEK